MDKMSKTSIHPAIYQIGKELGIKPSSNIEEKIRELCVQKVEEFWQDFVEKDGGSVSSLDKLLSVVATKLGVKFEEIHSEADLRKIKETYLEKREFSVLEFIEDFDDDTDAVLVELKNVQPWEPKNNAIIDCRGSKFFRAYFSKWHEIAHELTRSPQRSLPFRRTRAAKKNPEEILMDKIAGDLGFYSPLFLPEVRARTNASRKLSFNTVEELRREVCPNASFEATLRAAVDKVSFPCIFLIAGFGLKKSEERELYSNQVSLFPEDKKDFKEKFRALRVQSNLYAKREVQLFNNMEVPESSILKYAYDNEPSGEIFTNVENLNWWKSSKGTLGNLKVHIEAKKIRDKVWAIICTET